MSTSVIEPGTKLAGRYRLEERISDSGGSSLWKAIDEILARAVAVRTFEPGFPRVAEVVTSARAASRLTDPRLTQVFDADDSGESAYVVSEWVVGETLEQMLAKAPLEPGRAATLLYEASEAMTAAHAAGLAHLCLTPRDLVWTTGGTVKLLGIATDAVLGDRYSDDPAGEDVRGLGRMLYAALTAHWPGAPDEPESRRSDLPAAPETGGVFHAPRQVQAGISHAIDAIVCRCLGIGDQEPLTTPADLAKALRGVPRTPLPLFAGLGSAPPPAPRPAPPTRPAARPAADSQATQQQPPASQRPHRRERAPQPARQPHPEQQYQHGNIQQAHTSPPSSAGLAAHAAPRRGPGGNRGLLLGVAAAAVTVIVGLSAWALTGDDDPGDNDPPGPGASQSPPPAQPSATQLKPVGAVAMEEITQGSHDSQINKNPQAVMDGKPKPYWETQTYTSGEFGRYSKGFGVTLDMGKSVTVSSVKINTPVSDVPIQLRVGAGRTLDALKTVGEERARPGGFTISPPKGTTGQYVLIWFPSKGVPPGFKAKLGEVTVYGSPG
ncbi:protein kinase family protein [Spirillospora sp. NBC_01491]|uniref:protein kinase family protein n=1 Tax=Spirillospora sp. NBC_01491 TaxID=2976007 RepID=UPI002E2F680C|nr:protein kinase family protein [Spirillospora sp. NBC_01491]